MNDKRRAKLRIALDLIRRAEAVIDTVIDEEQQCLDNLPENLEGGDRWNKMEDAIDAMDDIRNALGEACKCIDDVICA